jgi:two-component system OmpR family sensor kinase
MTSIRRQLLCWLLVLMVIGVGLASWMVYLQALAEANELFDYQLQEISAALPPVPFPKIPSSRDSDDAGIVLQIWNRNGELIYRSHPHVPLAPSAQLGFSTEHTRLGDWRVYGAMIGENVVQLAQPVSMRDQLAVMIAWHTLWPLVALLPFLGLTVWLVVGHGLAPLARLTQALEKRHPDGLQALPLRGLPREVMPLVQALNALLGRLTQVLDTQKTFIADAAHELRTPLAAVQIQAQLVARAQDAATRDEAIADLQAGVARATRLTGQLLTLARAEPDGHQLEHRVDLRALLTDCVAEHVPLAQQRGVDLGMDMPGQASADIDVTICGDAEALRAMFGNLLDNATKYTPAGGHVDVGLLIDGGHPVVRIADSGPGIPPAERERVFDRFYRATSAAAGANTGTGAAHQRTDVKGTGLGLAIVRRVADQHHAAITLGDCAAGGGLQVDVRFCAPDP